MFRKNIKKNMEVECPVFDIVDFLSPGDKVRIVDEPNDHWDDFHYMAKYAGQIVTVDWVKKYDAYTSSFGIKEEPCWTWNASDIAEIIYVNRETSTKSEVKEVERPAKVGEWIKIVAAENTYGLYENGDILKVYKREESSCRARFGGVYCELPAKIFEKDGAGIMNDNGNLIIEDREYVVLENYQPVVKEVKRPAKVGEWIKITAPWLSSGAYKKGDVFKVSYLSAASENNAIYVHIDDEHVVAITSFEYVVLENYSPEDGEKK